MEMKVAGEANNNDHADDYGSETTTDVKSIYPTEVGSPPSDYGWIPPCNDAHLIECYMRGLPLKERPLAGTEGMQLRKQRLVRPHWC